METGTETVAANFGNTIRSAKLGKLGNDRGRNERRFPFSDHVENDRTISLTMAD